MARPPKYKAVKELEDAIEAWKSYCEAAKILPTKTNLAMSLGIHSDTLNEYSKMVTFSVAIKSAHDHIEEAWVQRMGGNVKTVAGIIFYLKNAFASKYRDRHDVDMTHHVPKPILDVLQDPSHKENSEALEEN